MTKKVLCVFVFMILLITQVSAGSIEYKVDSSDDNIICISYTDPSNTYIVKAYYFKLYFECKVEVYFTKSDPSKETMATIEWEQLLNITNYFQLDPYRPPISKRKYSSSRKLYTFMILFNGKTLYNM